MKVYNSIPEFHSDKQTIATIGTFDGVHIGHKKIIEKIVQAATASNCESLILTFFPHPRMVLKGKSDILLLNTLEEKKELLQSTGLDHLIVHPFDTAFSMLSAEEFVKTILVDRFNIKKIIIGHDHRFGRNRSADINDLAAFGKTYGFEVAQIPAQEIDAVSISSTKIRNALLQGDMALANSYLGYDYFVTGTVVKGRQIGRTIGVPTANIKVAEDYKLIPAKGVYVASSLIRNKLFYGMMSIGTNPTVAGKDLTIEVNYFDLDEDLYGQALQVSVLHRIRDEEKFDSLEQLKNEIAKDKMAALAFISKRQE